MNRGHAAATVDVADSEKGEGYRVVLAIYQATKGPNRASARSQSVRSFQLMQVQVALCDVN